MKLESYRSSMVLLAVNDVTLGKLGSLFDGPGQPVAFDVSDLSEGFARGRAPHIPGFPRSCQPGISGARCSERS